MDYLKRNRTIEGEPFEFSRDYEETGAQEPILFPGGIKGVSITLKPTEGEAKIQVSSSPEEKIKAGTAIWIDHSSGTVSDSIRVEIGVAAAVRVNISSGTASVEIRA